MYTQADAEKRICMAISQIMRGFLGRAPESLKCHIFEDTLTVRLWKVFGPLERNLMENKSSVLKSYRIGLIESLRGNFETMTQEILLSNILTIHHDVILDHEVLFFTLASSPVSHR